MHVEFLINGGISLLLSPENDMEVELLKGLVKQTNDITEIRTNVVVLNKSYKAGLLIARKNSSTINAIDGKNESETQTV